MSSGRRRVVSSPDAQGRLAQAAAWLAEKGSGTELFVVGGTMQAAAELTRRVGRDVGGTFGWHRLTLAQLAWRLAEGPLAQQGKVAVTRLALEAVCARVVHVAHASGTAGRFTPIADRPGLPRALAQTLSELRLAGVDPKEMGDADLASLASDYRRELERTRLADRADVLATACAAALGGPAMRALLGGKPVLLLDVPILAALERDLVRAVAETAGDLLVTLPAGDERTRKHLAEIGLSVEEAPRATTSARSDTALARLQAGLFAEVTAGRALEEGLPGVEVFSAPGESRECVEIARLMHREAERGIPFDRMAVLLRSPTQYRAHLEEAFRRASIPAHFARGTAKPDPTGRAFLALLACASERLSASRFAEYLSIGEVPDATAAGAPPPPLPEVERWVPPEDELAVVARPEAPVAEPPPAITAGPVAGGTLRAPRLWERLLVDAAVIGGLDRWTRRLDGLHQKYERDLEEIHEPSDPRALGIRRDQAALKDLRQYALPLLEELARFPEVASWGAWLGILDGLATRALRKPGRVLGILAELRPMADVGPVGLSEVRIVLEQRLTEVVEPPSDRRFGRVYVASTDEARGLAFDVVFIPGLAEKLFPQKIAEDPILPDAARHGMSLVMNADRAAMERLALRLAVGAATERVVVSYPRLDLDQSRPRTPSFYGLEVLRAAEGKLPGFDDLARRANVTGAARVGWPAPTRPADAIDHAEHDLALLESVLRRPESETVGMARYLLSANEHLARALRFRGRRWTRKWTESDGLVAPPPLARLALAEHDLSSRSYSPTGLQNFASCPYRFLLQAIHRLSPREEPQPLEELDPLQRGSLVHQVLFELHSVLRDQGLLPVTASNHDRARVHLDRVLAEVVADNKDDLAPAIERVWDDGVAGIGADLREWLRRATFDPTWKPVFFELSFGLKERGGRDAGSVDAPVQLDCGILFRGSIDLVEQSATGALRATDYKTGKVRAKEEMVIGGGEILQPVLYALVLEKVHAGVKVEGGRLYYCTSVGEFTAVEVPLDDAARKGAQLVADTVHKAVAGGFLPAAPAKKACEYCDYLRICGPYEEQRTARKRKDELVPLETLRRQR
jgi:CRISPR/Cas system-associated exonuclease Cas4 (RecB family)